jgi:hypothetical protein
LNRYSGRLFTPHEIEQIRDLLRERPDLNRAALSRVVCEQLGWMKDDGKPKDMSCRVAMLAMHRQGLIVLPPPLKRNGNGRRRPLVTEASAPREHISLPAGSIGRIRLQLITSRKDSFLWNELIERHHYLGYQPLPGAQLRYFVFADAHLVAALGFGAAAWKVRPRDAFIGWSPQVREKNLGLVANNARFLIMPWVASKNLASKILAIVARRLPPDWEARYAQKPVLLETFVEQQRFKGTCYRAANWIHVGKTQGRGKLDRFNQFALPVKDIFLYPLEKKFREVLCSMP